MADVGKAGHQAAVRTQPAANLSQHLQRLAEMLQHVGADHTVEAGLRNVDLGLLDVGRVDRIEPRFRLPGRPRVAFDADDPALLPRPEGGASRPQPQPISSTLRAVVGVSASTSGRSNS